MEYTMPSIEAVEEWTDFIDMDYGYIDDDDAAFRLQRLLDRDPRIVGLFPAAGNRTVDTISRAITDNLTQIHAAGYPLLSELWRIIISNDDQRDGYVSRITELQFLQSHQVAIPDDDDWLVSFAVVCRLDLPSITFLVNEVGAQVTADAWMEAMFLWKDANTDKPQRGGGPLEKTRQVDYICGVLDLFIATGFVPINPYKYACGDDAIRFIHDRLGVPIPGLWTDL